MRKKCASSRNLFSAPNNIPIQMKFSLDIMFAGFNPHVIFLAHGKLTRISSLQFVHY